LNKSLKILNGVKMSDQNSQPVDSPPSSLIGLGKPPPFSSTPVKLDFEVALNLIQFELNFIRAKYKGAQADIVTQLGKIEEEVNTLK
jgi:hypothetical protein